MIKKNLTQELKSRLALKPPHSRLEHHRKPPLPLLVQFTFQFSRACLDVKFFYVYRKDTESGLPPIATFSKAIFLLILLPRFATTWLARARFTHITRSLTKSMQETTATIARHSGFKKHFIKCLPQP